MNSKKILGILGALVIGALFLVACQNNVNTTLEDSVAPYLELQAVEGASNVTMTVNRGAVKGLNSYFAIDFSNFDSDGIVSEGLKEGWCLDYQRPIGQNNDVHEGIKMFNTFGSENWKSANYLMNIKNELIQNDPSITYKEIQVALWSLIEVPVFNIDKALAEGTMPSRMMTNGSPNFSVEKTKGIVNKVRKEVDDFVYKPGTPAIIYSNTAHDDQDVGTVEGETAWAVKTTNNGEVNSDYSTCHIDLNNISGDNWGWSNGTYSDGHNDTFDIYAGAAQCDLDKGTFIGTFSFTYDGSELNYTLDLTVDNDLANLHIYAGNNILPTKNGNYTNAPGQLGYKAELDGGTKTYTGTIDGLSENIYIAVHLGDEIDD